MAVPVSLLKGARAFARDQAREAMAAGYLWDVVNFVPEIIDAPLTGRGGWLWGSEAASTTDFLAGILAPFSSGEENLACDAGTLYQVDLNPPYALTPRGAVPPDPAQNPVMLFDQTIWMSGSGATPPYVAGPGSAPVELVGRPNVKVGTIWGHYFVGGNAPGGQEDTVFWSPPSDVSAGWDANALWRTSGAVTGLAGLRNVILVFHAASVERLRGTRPPAGTVLGDMVLEPLFGQVGTTEPKSIAYWRENVLFADEHGVHITDGVGYQNLVQLGQIQSYWRTIYNTKERLAAAVFLDLYVISISTTALDTITLVCDLSTKRWFRFTNVKARSMWASAGTTRQERFWGGIDTTRRIARLSPMFFPDSTVLQIDDDGIPVEPYFETAFYKLAPEGRKRVRFVYLSYDARAVGADPLKVSYILSPQDTVWTPAGTLPVTSGYSRFRLPVGKNPYGIAFRVDQTTSTNVTRISDLAVDAHAIERSRV